MLWIVKKRLGNASSGTDGIEVNGDAVTLHLSDGCNNSAPSVLTLFGGQAHNGLSVSFHFDGWPPRFLFRSPAGRSNSERTFSMPSIWSPRSLAYISQPFSWAIVRLFLRSSSVATITGVCSGVVTSLWHGPLSLVKQAFCRKRHFRACE